MNKNLINIITTVIFSLTICSLSLIFIISPKKVFSDSERRELAKKPLLNSENISSGDFAEKFETYMADQFPKRESFRSIKAHFITEILGKKDNNEIFSVKGHLSKLDPEENHAMTEHAAEKFTYIYNNFIKDKVGNVYLTIIPDKNYVLAEKNGYPSMDYDTFIENFKNKVPFMEYIEIRDLLDADDYYKTDSHWRQEKITDIALRIAEKTGTELSLSDYEINTVSKPFYGVYAGQSGLNPKPDTIFYLTNDTIDNCKITYYDDFGNTYEGKLYDSEKALGKDPYEMFLSGSKAIVEIENPNSESDKELVIFRDSFASSLAPLLAGGYKKIILADIRYIKSYALEHFVDFTNSDVLFAYSTSLLNNSMSLN